MWNDRRMSGHFEMTSINETIKKDLLCSSLLFVRLHSCLMFCHLFSLESVGVLLSRYDVLKITDSVYKRECYFFNSFISNFIPRVIAYCSAPLHFFFFLFILVYLPF